MVVIVNETLKDFVIAPLLIHGGMQKLLNGIRLLTFIFVRLIHDFSPNM